MSITVSDIPVHRQGVREDNVLTSLVLSAAKAMESQRKSSNPIRISNAGKCTRQIAYAYHNWRMEKSGDGAPFVPEPLEPRVLINFSLGDLVEEATVEWLVKASEGRFMPLPDTRRNAVYLDLGDGHQASGHLDGLWQEDDKSISVVDIKSINSKGFDALEEYGPDESYVYQMNGYCEAMSLERWRLFYFRKETGHVKEFTGTKNPVIVQRIKQKFRTVITSTWRELPFRDYQAHPEKEYVRGQKQLIGSGCDVGKNDPDGKRITEMKKTGYWRETGRKVLVFPCSYCGFKKECWPSVEMEMKGDAPVWVVPE